MGQGERIEWINPCPLTPSLKRSLEPQGIKMRMNLHPGIPILVVFILALILMASILEIFFVLIPVDWLPSIHGWSTLGLDLLMIASIWWILGITLLAGLIVDKLRPDSLNRPTLVTVSLALILMVSGLVILWMLRLNLPVTGGL